MKKGLTIKNFLFLHFTVFIFAVSAVSNKIASNYMKTEGFFSIPCLVFLGVYGLLTILYAILWQYNLEKYELSFLYTNRIFYMVWTQIFAVAIFGNEISIQNIIGLLLIIIGTWVNSKDA